MKSPFKFLDSFELSDKHVFFGFDQEIDALYQLAHQTNLLLVYGFSGTGKTSLIQCGLASRFDGPQWFPFYVRRGENINKALRKALAEVLAAPFDKEQSPTSLVEHVYDRYFSPVYLLFDQFEELFTLGTAEEQQQFARDIQQLLSQDLPCKVIFIIREEFLGGLDGLEKILPQLFDFKFRVEAMNYQRIRQILLSSFRAFNISLEPDEEDRMEEMIGNLSGKQTDIQLSYLQVYLDMLWKEVYSHTFPDGKDPESSAPPLTFTRREIARIGQIDDVLQQFLADQEIAIQQVLMDRYPEADLNRKVVFDVLDAFVTQEGTKQPIYFDQEDELLYPRTQDAFGLDLPILSDCIALLERKRILRRRDHCFELAHDSLATLIDEKRNEEQKRHNRIRREIEVLHGTNHYLNQEFLSEYRHDLPHLALSPELQQFVRESEAQELKRREKQRRLQEEKQQQRELEIKLAMEQQAGRRKRNAAIGISILALLAVSAMLYAFKQRTISKNTAFELGVNTAERQTQKIQYGDALNLLDRLQLEYPPNTISESQGQQLDSLRRSWSTIDSLLTVSNVLLAEDDTASVRKWPLALDAIEKASMKDTVHLGLRAKVAACQDRITGKAREYYRTAKNSCGIRGFEQVKGYFQLARHLAPDEKDYQNITECPEN